MLGRGLLVGALLSVAGCALVTGNEQTVEIATPGVTDAGCALTSPTVTRYVKTPGEVVLDKSSGDVSIICRKEGYYNGIAILSSDYTKKAWRKLLFGKLTGLAVSAATVGLSKYPESIEIYMEKASRDGLDPDGWPIATDGPKSRWVGTGDRDACGRAWAMDITREGDRVSGTVWRENIEYELRGEIDRQDRMAEASAGRSVAFDGAKGPRALTVTLHFSNETAEGHYQVDRADGDSCATPFALRPLTTD